MVGKELLKILHNGLRPVVEFTKLVDDYELDPDEGMQCEILSYGMPDRDNIFSVMCNFKGFKNYNLNFAKPCWYDKNNEPKLIWFETGYYPKDEIYELCLSTDGELPFNIVSKNKTYEEYKESKSLLNYIAWLENKNQEQKDALDWIAETSLKILRQQPVRNFDEILTHITSLTGKKYI